MEYRPSGHERVRHDLATERPQRVRHDLATERPQRHHRSLLESGCHFKGCSLLTALSAIVRNVSQTELIISPLDAFSQPPSLPSLSDATYVVP